MCGICGIIDRKGVDQGLLRRMADTMRHRGPDEEGYAFMETAGLGHRRLKIIDLETGGQPMSNEDKSLFLVCNGEIYNFIQLREELEKRGHRFTSRSDNEVILHLYEEKGERVLDSLRGMYAFAIWDEANKELFLARDRIGKKPLVYSLLPGGIIFASELKALLLHPSIRKEIDTRALDLFITYQAVPSPLTIFRNIRKLPPAHWLRWKNGETSSGRYWDVDFAKKASPGKIEEYSELVWESLTEATRLRMVSDVPLGAFLSGGIDSSTIVGIMSGLSKGRVKTFSVGFDEESYSELKYAAIAAKRFSTEHHEFTVKPDVMEILPKLVWHYSEPFGDSSMVPSYYVARETKKHVTVALNGDGGDESLAGYTRYWQMLLLERISNTLRRLPLAVRRKMMSILLAGYGKHPTNTFFRVWKWLDETEKHGYEYAYGRRLSSFSVGIKDDLYSGLMKDSVGMFDGSDPLGKAWKDAGDVSLLEKMLYSDMHLYLPEVLTVKMDIATMSNSLEARSPFLDHKFIETAASLPPSFKFRGFTSKYILKRRLKGFLPDPLIRRKKMGFGMPLGEWFAGDLKGYLAEHLVSERFSRREYFNPKVVRKMVEEHISGKAVHTARLWNLLVFEIWYRIFMEGEGFE